MFSHINPIMHSDIIKCDISERVHSFAKTFLFFHNEQTQQQTAKTNKHFIIIFYFSILFIYFFSSENVCFNNKIRRKLHSHDIESSEHLKCIYVGT